MIMKEVSMMWCRMSKEEKSEYKKLSDKDRMRFDSEK